MRSQFPDQGSNPCSLQCKTDSQPRKSLDSLLFTKQYVIIWPPKKKKTLSKCISLCYFPSKSFGASLLPIEENLIFRVASSALHKLDLASLQLQIFTLLACLIPNIPDHLWVFGTLCFASYVSAFIHTWNSLPPFLRRPNSLSRFSSNFTTFLQGFLFLPRTDCLPTELATLFCISLVDPFLHYSTHFVDLLP